MTEIYDLTARLNRDEEVALTDYSGKALLIVNTASRRGFTPQYAGLDALNHDLQDRGLVVLGFPCNQFGAQEPGNAHFCLLNYDVNFPLFNKDARTSVPALIHSHHRSARHWQ
jgi:glutathione peroxidase